LKQALADFDAVLKLDPTSFEARLRRAETYRRLGQVEQANSDLAQLTKTKPSRPDEFLKRGLALEAEGHPDAAIADATKTIEQDKILAPAGYILRSTAYVRKDDLQAALKDINQAIELDPKNAEAFQYRFVVNNRLKRFPEALADTQKAIELSPTNPVFQLNRAYALAQTGDYGGARQAMDEAEKLGQKSAWFYNNLAWLLSTADDDKVRDGTKAEEAIKEALELLPNDPAILDTRAAVCAELGQFEEAVKWEKKYLGTKSLTAEQRKNGEARLNRYQQRQPYREAPGG
jgi:tetratricopeptide (TPR) repeat protein